jgi:hypothetical protein
MQSDKNYTKNEILVTFKLTSLVEELKHPPRNPSEDVSIRFHKKLIKCRVVLSTFVKTTFREMCHTLTSPFPLQS